MRFLALALLLALLSVASPVGATEDSGPVKIGMVSSRTMLPAYMERAENAARMAVEEFNESGGLNGQKIELIARDDRSSAQDGLDVIAWLTEHEKVALILSGSTTHIALAMATYAAREKVPFFAMWCDSLKCDAPEKKSWHFILADHPHHDAASLAAAAAKFPAKRWGMIGSPIEWSQEQRRLFSKELRRLRPDVEIATDQSAPIGKLNGGAVVEVMKWKKVEAVFTTAFGRDLVDFTRQARARGMAKDTRYVTAYLVPEELAGLKHADLDGWYGLGFPEEEMKDPAYVAFRETFQKKYRQNPGYTGLQSYVNTKLALAALAKAGGPDRAKIREAARGLSIATPVGPVAIDPETHRVNFTNWFGMFRVMKDGSVRLTDTTRGRGSVSAKDSRP